MSCRWMLCTMRLRNSPFCTVAGQLSEAF
jgi:hypothetical protein